MFYNLFSYNYGLIFCVHKEIGVYKHGKLWMNHKLNLSHKIKQLSTQT